MNKEKKINGQPGTITVFLNKYLRHLIIFVSLLVLIPAFFYLILPEYRQASNLSDELLPLKEKKYEELNQYYNDLNKLGKNLEYLEQLRQSDFDKLEKILPKKADIAGLFAQVEALFLENGFEVTNLSFTESKVITMADEKVSPIGMVDISLNTQGGGYFDFKELLENIEKHLRIFDVVSINFSNIYSEDEDDTANYDLNLRTYYLN